MPDSVLALVLFVALVAPGVSYVVAREARRGERQLSQLRETAAVVLVGVLCDVVVVSSLATLRALRGENTPDFPALVAHPAKYATQHLTLVWWWGITLVVCACVLGLVLGRFDPAKPAKGRTEPSRFRRFLNRRLGPIEFASAWSKYLAAPEGSLVHCSCVLEDGSWVGGYVRWFNTDMDETADRDMVLWSPVTIRYADEDEAHELSEDLVVLSARRIMRFGVTMVAMPP